MRYLKPVVFFLVAWPFASLAEGPLSFGDWIAAESGQGRYLAMTGNGPARLAVQFRADTDCKPMLSVAAPKVKSPATIDLAIDEQSFKQSATQPMAKALLEAMRKGKTATATIDGKAVPFSLSGSNAATETAASLCILTAIRFNPRLD